MSPGSSQAKNKVVRGTHEVELRAYTFICAATICRRMIILVAWKLFSKSNYIITIFAGVFRPLVFVILLRTLLFCTFTTIPNTYTIIVFTSIPISICFVLCSIYLHLFWRPLMESERIEISCSGFDFYFAPFRRLVYTWLLELLPLVYFDNNLHLFKICQNMEKKVSVAMFVKHNLMLWRDVQDANQYFIGKYVYIYFLM